MRDVKRRASNSEDCADRETLRSADVKIDLIRRRLRDQVPGPPREGRDVHAAVAVVFRERADSLDVLLIERALRQGDPWSGHMAFPGGRLEPRDPSSRHAAERETLEEVGVDLAAAEYLGPVSDLSGGPRKSPTLIVAAHAFFTEEDQPLRLDPAEVRSAFWFPLKAMLDETRRVDYSTPERPGIHYPGILVGIPGRHVVWGLTYRFLGDLLEVLGHRIPRGPSSESGSRPRHARTGRGG